MKRIRSTTVLLCIMFIAVVGCRGGGQIYNVKDAPISTATGKEATLDQITKAIVEAGSGLGWTMAVVKPGQIVGTLHIRSHTAIVEIPYTTKTYSIIYKDSTNLKYDAEKQTIHENYRGWIQNLDKAIKSRLSGLGV
ncbi:MAG: hypothetical protein NNA22_06130 [Nitrospira sp.]|nr:hypothetical protein [Nitrospira sp.]